MSTRKRVRPSLNPNDDEDELSPSKPTSAPLSAVKKRKLNTYGKPKSPGIFGKLGSLLGYGQSGLGKENAAEVDEKDQLAPEDAESEKEEGDIWEVPDEEESTMATVSVRGTPKSTEKAKGTPTSQGKVGSAKAVKKYGSVKSAKKDMLEVEDSEEDRTVSTRGSLKRSVNHTLQLSKSTSKSRNEVSENATPKRSLGRAMNQFEIVVPSPKRSTGKPRAADILKKAKALSREAMFKQMEEAGKKAAAEESEELQSSRRRRSDRAAQLEEGDDAEGSLTSPLRRGRRLKNGAFDPAKEAPKGILTPTKERALKSRKSVAFEKHDDIDLGFKDLPDSANKTSTSKKVRGSKDMSRENAEKPTTEVPAKKLKKGDTVVEIPQSEEEEELEDIDGEACAVCKGLDSKEGNEMILCDSCDFPVHLKCYDLSETPEGDWYCRDCNPDNEGILSLEADDDVAMSEVFNDLPEIEALEDHLQHVQRLLLDRLTGQKQIRLRGHDEDMRKVHQVVEQTVLAGEGNSMLVIGARGSGKTTLVESVISELATDHRENFHVVRLNGFIHTDDKLALKEIWRQLGREMDAENEMTGKANHADTLASLLALLSHPSEISEGRADETAKSVVFVLDEFDLFTTHSRQTLLYNLFDIAQARKAPIVVLGLTTRIDVVETLEKRVKSRFSHRYVHLSLPKSLPAFWEICKEGLLVETKDLGDEGFALGISGQEEFISFWQFMIDDLYNKDAAFKQHLQSHFCRSKSVPAFFTSCIIPIANLSARNFRLTGRKFTSSAISLSAPDSKLHILQGLSELELALLIAAARLDIILDTDTCNFAMAYDEYSSLTSRHKIQTSSAGVTALGASAKVWGRNVALGAWERLAEYNLLVPAGIGGGLARDLGAGGRMWKVDVGLEEITGSVESLSGVMAKWCREI